MAASLVPCSSPLLLQSARMAVLLKPNLSFFFIRRASSSLVCSSAMAPPPPDLIASPSPLPPQGKDRRESLLDLLRSRHVRDKGRPQGGGGGRGKKSPQDEGMPLPLPSSSPSSFSPLSSFEEAGLNEEMLSVVRELKLSVPTEVQWMGIPAILAGESIVLASHTGSGKTLAYLLPLIQCLRRDEKESGKSTRPRRPRAVVLCPTRELAEQVFHVAKSICHHARFRAVMVGGGCRWRPQEDALNTPVDMVVGTPGRVLVHISEGNMVYGDVKYVVLDEADTMFDAGFGEDIRKFLGPLRNRAATRVGDEGFQTVLVTATITKAVQKLIDEEFPGIRHVHTSTLHKKIATAKHGFIKISGAENKLESLLQVLETSVKKKERVMVFCNTLNSCRAVDHFLRENNIQTINYHGEVPAEERVEGIQKFKEGESSYSVLVCTDLAARGLDLVVDHVVMFDFPLNPIDYLHRTGRTARMGAKGKVTSLVTKRNSSLAEQIEDAISKGETLEALTTVTREKPEVPKKQAVRLNPKERKMPGKKFDSRQVKTGSASAKKLKPALKVKPIRKVSKLAAKFVPGSKKASSSGGRRGAKSARA